MLVEAAKNKGITAISLEATDMGRPLYEKYGFTKMNSEMELLRSLKDDRITTRNSKII